MATAKNMFRFDIVRILSTNMLQYVL